MAADLHNRDSILFTSQFFADEEANILSSGNSKLSGHQQDWSSCFGSTDSWSSLSSPVESELGSTESESDQDEDYIAELIRQMTHYMLKDDDNKQEKKWDMAGSPQSTLWSELGTKQEEAGMKGKFEKLKTNEEKLKSNNNSERFSNPSLKASSVPAAVMTPNNSCLDFQSKQALIDDQIRAIQLCKLKQQHIIKKQEEYNWGKQANGHNNQFQSKGRASNGQKMSRPNLQQQRGTGSEMRAVFLGEPSSRNGSSGTGVFLPRGVGNSSEARKKQGCSSVLIPARVVHALKLHFDKVGVESKPIGASTFPFQNDALMGDVRYGLQLELKNKSHTVPAINHHQEIGLPQEWTY